MQITSGISDLIARLVAIVRSLFSRIIEMFSGLLGGVFSGGNGSAPPSPSSETIPVIIEPETTAIITPFRIFIAVVVVLIAIFVVIIHEQSKEKKYNKKQVFEQAHFSNVEGRGNDRKSAENESESKSAEVQDER
jgi:mannitol-specific phosphotransferase system IIBC component